MNSVLFEHRPVGTSALKTGLTHIWSSSSCVNEKRLRNQVPETRSDKDTEAIASESVKVCIWFFSGRF